MKMHHSDHAPNGFDECTMCLGKGVVGGLRFEQVVPYLRDRLFIGRKLWRGRTALVVGSKGTVYLQSSTKRQFRWIPVLQELQADDWEILHHRWDGEKDNYAPFIIPDL